MQDPDTLRYMIEQNPMLKSMFNQNPMMKMVLDNPQLMKQVFSNSWGYFRSGNVEDVEGAHEEPAK